MMVMMMETVHKSLFCRNKDKRFFTKQKNRVYFFIGIVFLSQPSGGVFEFRVLSIELFLLRMLLPGDVPSIAREPDTHQLKTTN